MIGTRALLAAVSALLAAPLAAHEGSDGMCELHVWPAAGLRFSDQGMWDNFKGGLRGGILGNLTTPEARMERSDREMEQLPAAPRELMAMAEQAALLKALPDASILGMPQYRLVVHDTALGSREIRSIKGRYAPESAPCYADLVLDSLVFSNEWGNGQNLKSLYRFRDFGTGETSIRSFGAWVDSRLAIEPDELPAKLDEAEAEMRAAFTNNIALFGAALTKNATTPPKQGKKK